MSFPHSNGVPGTAQLSAAGAAHGGVARRGRHAQGDGAGDEAPVSVRRGHKLQSSFAFLDWLEFTLPVGQSNPLEVAERLLSKLPPGAQPLEYGRMGYTHGWRLPAGGLLLYNPYRYEMGVHCSLPSGLLALLDKSPEDVIKLVLLQGGKFTRLDVAIDTDQVHISEIDAAVRYGNLVSRSQKRDYRGSYGGEGFTIYIGSRSSSRFIRIYDKAAEQKVEGVWTRCEVEFKAKQAQRAADHIASGTDPRALIVSSLDFRDSSADSNISRCPQLPWWSAWVGSVKRVSFAVRKAVDEVVKRAEQWVRKQVGPTLAFLDKVKMSRDPHWLFRLCDDNGFRISTERQMILLSGGAP